MLTTFENFRANVPSISNVAEIGVRTHGPQATHADGERPRERREIARREAAEISGSERGHDGVRPGAVHRRGREGPGARGEVARGPAREGFRAPGAKHLVTEIRGARSVVHP